MNFSIHRMMGEDDSTRVTIFDIFTTSYRRDVFKTLSFVFLLQKFNQRTITQSKIDNAWEIVISKNVSITTTQ